MTNKTTPDFEALKARMKATWMAGDFGQVAKYAEHEAVKFISRQNIKPGMRVLDVACGTGNLAIPAAKAGAMVTGVVSLPIWSNKLVSAQKAKELKFSSTRAMQKNFPTLMHRLMSWSACLVQCSRPVLIA